MSDTSYARTFEQSNKLILYQMLEIGVNIASAVLSGYREIDDPVLKHSLFIDKFNIMIHSLLAVMNYNIADMPVPLKLKIEKLTNDVTSDLKSLSDWVRNPMYSPDHAYGNVLMNKSQKDFTKNVTSETGGL